jgi:hypothetical protein
MRLGWHWGWGLALSLACAALAAWVASRYEQVPVQRWQQARGEARTNPYYALAHLAHDVGVPLVVRHSLKELPPANATLVLDSPYWRLWPENLQRVRQWTEAGGHLVIVEQAVTDDKDLSWVPIQNREAPRQPAPTAAEAASAASAAQEDSEPVPAGVPQPRSRPECPVVQEPLSDHMYYGIAVTLRLCRTYGRYLVAAAGVSPTWVLEGEHGPAVMRVPVGRGDATRVAAYSLLDTRDLTVPEQAATAAAVMQWQQGRAVWVLAGERREPLPLWLWQQVGAAMCALAIALVFWLWRRSSHLGPRALPPPRARRSMTEQILGSAGFLLRHHDPALLQAAVLALRQQAYQHLPGSRTLQDAELWSAIAKATHVDNAALALACQLAPQARSGEQLGALYLIESTRRRLGVPTP